MQYRMSRMYILIFLPIFVHMGIICIIWLYSFGMIYKGLMTNGFREYLLKQSNVKPNHIPYLIKWVGNFYSFLKIAETSFITAEHKNTHVTSKKSLGVKSPLDF